MKAAILEELNKPLVLRELKLIPLTVGQVLVRILVSGICGSQLHEIQGFKGNGKFLPHLMGHEGCGIVEEVGPGVSTVKVGDKVVMHWRIGSGIESGFPSYFLNDRLISSGKINTLAEKAIVSENRITTIPEDTDPEFAALLGCSLATALGIIENQSNLRFGETVVVIGCGGVGLNLIAAARLRGASVIHALDVVKTKKELAIKQGASTFSSSISDLPSNIDLVLDTSGNPEIIASAFSLLGDDGRIIMVGQPNPGQKLTIPSGLGMFAGNGQEIRATQGGAFNPQADIPRYLRLFESKQLPIDSLITHRFKLNEINDAFENLKSGLAGRIMIKISD